VPLVPQSHSHLSRALNLSKIQFVVLNERFQYSDLEAPGCLPYPVMRLSARSRGHLRNV
jgi:hypothetical protein